MLTHLSTPMSTPTSTLTSRLFPVAVAYIVPDRTVATGMHVYAHVHAHVHTQTTVVPTLLDWLQSGHCASAFAADPSLRIQLAEPRIFFITKHLGACRRRRPRGLATAKAPAIGNVVGWDVSSTRFRIGIDTSACRRRHRPRFSVKKRTVGSEQDAWRARTAPECREAGNDGIRGLHVPCTVAPWKDLWIDMC